MTMRTKLGRGGGLKKNSVFWTKFLGQVVSGTAGQFFTAARGNYDDGSDSAFDAAGLTAADVLFRRQTDPDGNPVGLWQ